MHGRVVLAIHGGAGRLAQSKVCHPRRQKYEAALAEALRAGYGVLRAGGAAERAVTEAVRMMENHKLFNAGRGGVLSANGRVELSASVMNGKDLKAGAVTGITRTKNPVLAARAMMPHIHVLLAGEDADRFSERTGLEMVGPDYFITKSRTRQWSKLKGSDEMALDHNEDDDEDDSDDSDDDDEDDVQGTVGAVARDRRGTVAAATSTGGLVNQWPGRIGDTPVIGAGTWADNRTCAISATGKGDVFARLAFARRVADLVELSGLDIEAASMNALRDICTQGGDGGCIVVDAEGRLTLPFVTPQMLRGWMVDGGPPTVAILPGEAVELPD